MPRLRLRGALVGVLFLLTHVTSVAALVLYRPALEGAAFERSTGSAGPVALAELLEGVLALGVVGTAVAIHPVIRRRHPSLALGYVALRTLEAGVIVIGIAVIAAVVALRSGRAPGLGAVADGLVAFHDGTFLLGPSFVLGVSTTVLAAVLLATRLVPRAIPLIGLVGGPLTTLSASLTLFGVIDQVSPWGAVLSAPVFAWELSLALWLVIRGFRPAALTAALRDV